MRKQVKNELVELKKAFLEAYFKEKLHQEERDFFDSLISFMDIVLDCDFDQIQKIKFVEYMKIMTKYLQKLPVRPSKQQPARKDD